MGFVLLFARAMHVLISPHRQSLPLFGGLLLRALRIGWGRHLVKVGDHPRSVAQVRYRRR